MPRADLLLALVRAGSKSDAVNFRRSLEAMIAEERAKQHHVLADRLEEYLNGAHGTVPTASHNAAVASLIFERVARRRIEDLILADSVRSRLLEFIEEQARQALLRAHGLEPRHRLLLVGPPGNGKTSTAEAVAESLSIPFLVVRYDGVIGSYLGETAARLRQVFDFARLRECVLFLDEFDTLGKERGDPHDTGEIKRVVSSLLLQIDDLPSYVVVITATNHAELLDRAVWRRFDLVLELPPPTTSQVGLWIDKLEETLGQSIAVVRPELSRALRGLSFGELEMFTIDVSRRLILAPEGTHVVPLLRSRIPQLADRPSRALEVK